MDWPAWDTTVADADIDLCPGQTGRVVVAMSGGVDSSVVAAVLAHRGVEVVGITLRLYDPAVRAGRPGSCCAGRDVEDARRVAAHLGIAHYVLDMEARFQEAVIADFAATYAEGRTPIPCVRCNQKIKFHDLLGTARDLGATALATGHYARRVPGPDGPSLTRARDQDRDQSYFLFATTTDQLSFLRFPLGGLTKDQTRSLARVHGLDVADKPDSQDICFVPDGRYQSVVARLQPAAALPGDIVHVETGRVLGRHSGIGAYTIGQRRGLGIGGRQDEGDGQPLFVVGLDAATRRVTVGPRSALDRDIVHVAETNWLVAEPETSRSVMVKLRSAQPVVPGRVVATGAGRATIWLDQPLSGIAPGQAAVFYEGERLIGGGFITSATLGEVAGSRGADNQVA